MDILSGKYNGLQTLVRKKNNLAVWVPCAANSLNLVVQDAAGCGLNAVRFFYFLEELYVYFTAATHRYQVLTECLKKTSTSKPIFVLKRTTTPRWSCREDAIKALFQGYNEIKKALLQL